MTLKPREPPVKLFLFPQNALEPPFYPTLLSGDVLIGAEAVDDVIPRGGTEGCEG